MGKFCICGSSNNIGNCTGLDVYKPEQLYYALKSIFTVDEQITPDGPRLTIKGLRQRAIKFMAPKMDAIDDIRYDLYQKIDEIVIDGRILLDEKRKKIHRILHEGMGSGCFDRRFVDRFSDELNKLQALCGRTYRFNYEVGMTLAFYLNFPSRLSRNKVGRGFLLYSTASLTGSSTVSYRETSGLLSYGVGSPVQGTYLRTILSREPCIPIIWVVPSVPRPNVAGKC